MDPQVTGWCTTCQIHRARFSDDYICPVCRDEQRRVNEMLYKMP